jgi:hypothetical protein
VLLTNKYQRVSSSASIPFLHETLPQPKPHLLGDHSNLATGWSASLIDVPSAAPDLQPCPQTHAQEIDPLYLFACHMAWEREEEPSAAWELLAAAQHSHPDTRAHARALLASSRDRGGLGQGSGSCRIPKPKPVFSLETDMAPYGLDIIDNCSECTNTAPGFFCGFSPSALQSLNDVSHKSILLPGRSYSLKGKPHAVCSFCARVK